MGLEGGAMGGGAELTRPKKSFNEDLYLNYQLINRVVTKLFITELHLSL